MRTETFARVAANWGVVPDFRPRAELQARVNQENEETKRVLRLLGVQPE
jgi:hypothetical protein